MAKNSGLKITRKYTSPGDPYQGIVWEKRTSKITNPDGSIVFEMNDVEIPSTWSQVATDIMVSKYFRKAGVPQVDEDGKLIKDSNGDVVLGSETSSRQVFDRLAETWRLMRTMLKTDCHLSLHKIRLKKNIFYVI